MDDLGISEEQIRDLWPLLMPDEQAYVLALAQLGRCSWVTAGEHIGKDKDETHGILSGIGRKIKRLFPIEFSKDKLRKHGQTTYSSVLFYGELNDDPQVDGMWLFRLRPAVIRS